MKFNGNCPACHMAECFACEDEHCLILTRNYFGERKCPFFKTKEQTEKEREYCHNRMAENKKGEI